MNELEMNKNIFYLHISHVIPLLSTLASEVKIS